MKTKAKVLTISLIFIVLAWVSLAAYIPYRIQQNTIDNLHSQVDDLNSEINGLRTSSQQTNPQQQTSPIIQNQTTEYKSNKGVNIIVYTPKSNSHVTSPIAILGQVPGNWSFEASFPIKLEDSNNNVISQTTGHVLGDWMTTNLVPFSDQITYKANGGATRAAHLVIEKDNPSGNSNNIDSVSIPITIE